MHESPLFRSCPPALDAFLRVSLRPLNVLSQETLVEENAAILGIFCIAQFVHVLDYSYSYICPTDLEN